MNRCSAPETRKNLEAANQLASIGIDFVCIPVSKNASKDELIQQFGDAMELLANEAEGNDDE